MRRSTVAAAREARCAASRAEDALLPVRDLNPRHGPAPVTWALIGINIVAFLIQIGVAGRTIAFETMRTGAFVPVVFFDDPAARWATPVTTAFLHADPLHLATNLFFLWVFGDNIEARIGHAPFLGFYLVAAAASSLIHGLIEPSSRLPMVGASGAISAVLAVYVLWFPRRRVQALIVPLVLPWAFARLLGRIPRFYLWWLPAWVFIGYWAVVQVVEAGGVLVAGMPQGGGVAWWAHVGGFLFGLALAPLLTRLTGSVDAPPREGPR